MKVIKVRNVNHALPVGVNYLLMQGLHEESRAGPVLVSPVPVTTVYARPQERVLFSAVRDANPIFHLMESLWLLAGRNDAKWLDQFVHDFSSRFAEADGALHGSYGFRWRNHFYLEGSGATFLPDQLNTVVEILRNNPQSRQAVIQMWDPVADLGQSKKDLPCNTTIYLRVRQQQVLVPPDGGDEKEPVLDITVCCRSNDLIWGCLAGDTVINSPEGDIEISRLAKRFSLGLKRFPVYAVDPLTGDMKLKWCKKAWKTGIKPVIELSFDDGTKLRLTRDHILYLKKTRRGKFNTPACIVSVEAGDLAVGDRIWAPKVPAAKSYLKFKHNILGSTEFSNMQAVHLAYDNLLRGKMPKGFEVHHKDLDKQNNRESNLERLEHSAHMSLHMSQKMANMSKEERTALANKGSQAALKAYLNLSDEEKQERTLKCTGHMSETKRKYWEGIDPVERSRLAKIASDAASLVNTPEELALRGKKVCDVRWKDPEQRERQAELMRRLNAEGKMRSNHKIVSIRELPPETVYDFTVEDYHTALVGSGVLAHNCYGANAVQFSVLLEYLAARIGVGIGTYFQISHNFHAYEDTLDKLEGKAILEEGYTEDYPAEITPIVTVPDHFDEDLQRFFASNQSMLASYANPFFREIAAPLYWAHHNWKLKNRTTAWGILSQMPQGSDWRLAAEQWFSRRMQKSMAK